MVWIKKGYPAYMLQEAQVEKYSVLAAISKTSIDWIFIKKGNTNGDIFDTFLLKLINDLKWKIDKYFEKLIITWDGAKYHSVEENKANFRKRRNDDYYYCSIDIAEFSTVDQFINWVKIKFKKYLRSLK